MLKFFCKLSSGSGEQLLTRQMCRLGQLLPLPELLTLYYAHAGYYLTQFLLSWVMPTVMFTWALVLASDCDSHSAFEGSCAKVPAPELMGKMLSSIYTYALLFLVLLATALPLFTEEWLQRSLKIAVQRLLKQVFTLSFLMRQGAPLPCESSQVRFSSQNHRLLRGQRDPLRRRPVYQHRPQPPHRAAPLHPGLQRGL